MHTAATNRRLRSILTAVRDGTLIPNPAFQRRLVWSNKHKVAFIETILDGLPFPEVFIAAGKVDSLTGEGSELLVDGQQRVTTLLEYFQGSSDLHLVGIPPYAELDEDKKIAFLEYEVVVRDLGSLSEAETRNLFQRINSTSYGLNAMEVNNARFDGALKMFCDELSDHSFFTEHSVFSGYDGKRMNDVRYCLTLVITVISTYFNRDSEHELFLEKYNDNFPEADHVRMRVDDVFSLIDEMEFPTRSRVWQKSDLFTLTVSLYRHWAERIAPRDAGQILVGFYDEVDKIAAGQGGFENKRATEYFNATRSGTNDRSSRVRRALVIESLLDMPGTLVFDEADAGE